MTKQIDLCGKPGKGKVVLVDDEDFEELNQYDWFWSVSKGKGYVRRAYKQDGKIITVYMHRVINKTPKDMVTDHKNGNTLDNRKSNLRSCTQGQNVHNSKGPKLNNKREAPKSKYKGVYPTSKKAKGNYKPWCALIKRMHLGRFDTEIEAAIAYNKKAIELFGEFAVINETDQ